MCGINTMIEEPCGACDDTAMNGIKVQTCNRPNLFNIVLRPQTKDITCMPNGEPVIDSYPTDDRADCRVSSAKNC